MPALEAVVVLIAGLIIKLLVTLAPFQGDNYRGVGWLWSTLIAGIGNGLSYFIGYIATLKPWEGRISPVSPCQPRRIRFRNWSIPPSSLNRSVSVTCDDVRPKRWHKPEVERLQAVHGFDTVSRFRMCFAAWGGLRFDSAVERRRARQGHRHQHRGAGVQHRSALLWAGQKQDC